MPGKFEGVRPEDREAIESLYAEVPDAATGSVQGLGWFALYRTEVTGGGWILAEDSNGFVDASHHDTDASLDATWMAIEGDAELWEDQGEVSDPIQRAGDARWEA